MKKEILVQSEKYRDDIVKFLRDIIAIPSESCQEEAVVKRILEEMKKCGFDDVYSDKLGNAVGIIGSGEKTILYDAHIDVVGVGDPDSWDHPPFDPYVKDGKIHGRGSVDEKPAIACMVYAGKIMRELDLLNDFRLVVVGSVMEEDCDGYPLIHLIENEGIRPDYVILGEPTDLNVYRGHRGRMEIIIRTKGESAHGAHEHLGDNAVYKMAPIIKEIEKLNKRLKHDDFLGKGSITISKISSTSPSLCSVSDSCEIYLDRRMTAGETKESVLAELKEITDAEIIIPEYNAISWKGTNAVQEKVFPTWVLPEDHELVRAGKAAADTFLDENRKVSRWHFSTNGVATMGRFNIPSIGFAPGLEELSHSTKEYIYIDDLIKTVQVYSIFPNVLRKTISEVK